MHKYDGLRRIVLIACFRKILNDLSHSRIKGMKAMDIEKKIIVGPTDTDSYNIIHHPQYFIWIEKAILEWLILTYGGIHELFYQINKFQCKFISPGILYDNLILQLRCKGKKATNNEENIRFQVKLINSKNGGSVMAADFFIKVKDKLND